MKTYVVGKITGDKGRKKCDTTRLPMKFGLNELPMSWQCIKMPDWVEGK